MLRWIVAITAALTLTTLVATSGATPARDHGPRCFKRYHLLTYKVLVKHGMRDGKLTSDRRRIRIVGACLASSTLRARARAYRAALRDAQIGERFTPYGRWAIPGYVVACESHGQNLAPNGAGASGYYQVIRSTWQSYGGGRYASEAYLAAKPQQDRIASRIWDGGRGASQWDCFTGRR